MCKSCLFGALVLMFACPDADARRRGRSPNNLTVKQKAKKHFKKGQKLFRKKKYAQAIVEFKQAYALRKHPAIQFNLAMSYASVNDTLNAARHIRIYLRTTKKKSKILPRSLRVVQDQTGILIVNTTNPSAKIFVDGALVGKGMVNIVVMIGDHPVDIRLGKRFAARKTIAIKPRQTRVWDVQESLLETPRPRRIITPGRNGHPPLTARRPGAGPEPAPKDSTKHKKLPIRWFVTTAAVAVAAVVAGVGIDQGLTVPLFREYERGGTTDRDLYNKVIAYRNVTISLYAAAGALGIAAAVIALYTKWKKRERAKSAVTILPVLGPRNIAFTLRWEH